MRNRWTLWMCIAVVGLFAVVKSARLQGETKKHVAVPVIAAKAEDVSSIDGIVKATYETISGEAGKPRQWSRDRTLYVPNVRFIAVEKDEKTGAPKVKVSSHQEYVDSSDADLVKGGFSERELGRETHQFGNIATVISSYEGKTGAGKVEARGVQIYQLYNDGKRWWIASLEWNEESAGAAIPAELLKK